MRGPVGQDLLTREWLIVPACPLEPVCVADIIPVFLLETIIAIQRECLPPEYECFFDRKADSLEEEIVLETAEMLEFLLASEGSVQVTHAHGEILDEAVDGGCSEGGAVEGGRGSGGVVFGSCEVEGEVVEDGD